MSQVDARAPRFSAAVTTMVLACALLTRGGAGLILVAWQLAVFALAAAAGVRRSPYSVLWRMYSKAARLGRPTRTEPEAGPRLAQALGAAMLTAALILSAAGMTGAAWMTVSVVAALSSLLATLDICVACRLYGLASRIGSGDAEEPPGYSRVRQQGT